MQRVKAVLEYDGTEYCGFVKQPGQRTIEAEIEKALFEIFKQPVGINVAGRTDSGVHAIGQVISFSVPWWKEDFENLKRAINAYLPLDVRIKETLGVADDFHARYSAKSREYVYTIAGRENFPFTLSRFVYRVFGKLDFEAMKKAAGFFVGSHDFSSFCTVTEETKSFTREILSFEVFKEKGNYYLSDSIRGRETELTHFKIRANAFLYHMVRTIAGTMLEVGRGKIEASKIPEILEAKKRKLAGATLPAHGLCLTRVYYGEEE
ncbi:MAG: tRNA pseudouridine(38-40) synthase TruA [Candidatus Saganbacteria bacterium]|nr:tRNA pseudouridine(38-40) synthase TruA [Candidatus Saganbacteria bacterium]